MFLKGGRRNADFEMLEELTTSLNRHSKVGNRIDWSMIQCKRLQTTVLFLNWKTDSIGQIELADGVYTSSVCIYIYTTLLYIEYM